MIDSSVFIARGATVLGDVHIGKDSSIWYYTVIRGDTERITIGAETNIQDLTMVHADAGVPCTVGNRVTVGHRVILHGCTVEDDCMIGMGAILLNGAKIGAGSVIGAGALVTEGTEIPPGVLAVGTPARVIRKLDEETHKRLSQAWQHYVAQAARHRSGALPIIPESLPDSFTP